MKIAVIGTRDLKVSTMSLYLKIQSYIKLHNLDVDLVNSGNACGSDQIANLFSVDPYVKIIHYLPWNSYNKELRSEDNNIEYRCLIQTQFDEEILELFPHMKTQSNGVWSLIRRNFQIILGECGDNPVDLVFYHVNTEEVSGGTKYGVVLAKKHGIKVVRI